MEINQRPTRQQLKVPVHVQFAVLALLLLHDQLFKPMFIKLLGYSVIG